MVSPRQTLLRLICLTTVMAATGLLFAQTAPVPKKDAVAEKPVVRYTWPELPTKGQINTVAVNRVKSKADEPKSINAEIMFKLGADALAVVGSTKTGTQTATGTDVTHIPYKGAVQNMTELIGGQINLIYTTMVSSEPQIKANRVRAIGVAAGKRMGLLPNVPTLAEFGIKDAEAGIWYGLQGPKGMPRPIVDKINKEVNRALGMADVKARLDQLGFEPAGGTPEDFDKVVKAEVAKLDRLLKAGLIKKE